MINPLKLGNKTFPNNLIQGPLAGVSAAPFRLLTSRYSKPAFTCTEMISVKTLLHKSHIAQKRYLIKDPDEGPLCFQLAGNNPKELAEAVKIVTDYGADLIDLNCGCPVKKMRKKGVGSALLHQSTKLYQLIKSMKDNTHIPVSIKIRIDGNSSDKNNDEIIKVVNDAGIDFLIVHGRHWTESYDVTCHYQEIKSFVDQVKIPVIGNGDIKCMNSLNNMLSTGCAGAMISRAGVGQPWLIRQLIQESQNIVFQKPSHSEIGLLFIEHVTKLSFLSSTAIFESRKFAKYYARDLANKNDFYNEINTCNTLPELIAITKKYFLLSLHVM